MKENQSETKQSEAKQCPKCAGRLEEGFVADFNLTNVLQSVWVEGLPQHSFWTGTSGVKMTGRIKRRIQTYRCVACGYLESFANEEWPTP